LITPWGRDETATAPHVSRHNAGSSLGLGLAANARGGTRATSGARGQQIGRPKVLDKSKPALARRMHAKGESASTIAAALGVSRATVYRVLAEQPGSPT
jgi:DNA invertase Pin-like site-specific DNA recombinase